MTDTKQFTLSKIDAERAVVTYLNLVAKFEKQKELVKKLHVILKKMNKDDGELKEVFSIIDEILDEE